MPRNPAFGSLFRLWYALLRPFSGLLLAFAVALPLAGCGYNDIIDRDELAEITPDAVRVRKQVLDCNRRPRRDDDREV